MAPATKTAAQHAKEWIDLAAKNIHERGWSRTSSHRVVFDKSGCTWRLRYTVRENDGGPTSQKYVNSDKFRDGRRACFISEQAALRAWPEAFASLEVFSGRKKKKEPQAKKSAEPESNGGQDGGKSSVELW